MTDKRFQVYPDTEEGGFAVYDCYTRRPRKTCMGAMDDRAYAESRAAKANASVEGQPQRICDGCDTGCPDCRDLPLRSRGG